MFGDLFQPTELIVAVILVAIFWLIVSDVRSAWRGRGPASSDCYFHWYLLITILSMTSTDLVATIAKSA